MSRDFRRVDRETAWLSEDRLMMARSLGLLKPGTVSLDGTRVKANASRHKALSREYANRHGAQLHVPAELTRCEDRLAEARAGRSRPATGAAASRLRHPGLNPERRIR